MGPRDALEGLLNEHGEYFQVQRPGATSVAKGLRNHEKTGGRQYIGFLPESDIKPSDLLIGQISHDHFRVIDIASNVAFGQVWQLKAYYESEHTYQQRRSAPLAASISIGTISNSAIQQGSPGAIQSFSAIHDHSDVCQIVADVLTAVESLQLTSEQKTEMIADAETIQAQLKKANPGSSIIRGCLEGIKGLLEKAAIAAAAAGGTAVAQNLLEQISKALK